MVKIAISHIPVQIVASWLYTNVSGNYNFLSKHCITKSTDTAACSTLILALFKFLFPRCGLFFEWNSFPRHPQNLIYILWINRPFWPSDSPCGNRDLLVITVSEKTLNRNAQKQLICTFLRELPSQKPWNLVYMLLGWVSTKVTYSRDLNFFDFC